MIAVNQHITYEEHLPLLLGSAAYEKVEKSDMYGATWDQSSGVTRVKWGLSPPKGRGGRLARRMSCVRH